MTSFSQDIDLWYNLNHSSLLTNYKYFKTNCIPKLSRHCFHNFVWRHKATAMIYTSVIGAECWQQPMRLFTNKITKPLQSYLVVVGGWLLFHPSQVPTGALSPFLLTHTQGLDIISIKSPDGVSTSKGTVQYLQENMNDQDMDIREGFNKLSTAN